MEDLRNRKILAGKTSRHIKFLKNLQFETGKLKNGDLQKQDNS